MKWLTKILRAAERKPRPSERGRCRRRVAAIEPLEDRSLLAISFVFDYLDVGGNSGTGFDDAALGQIRRDALESAAAVYGSFFDHTATVDIEVSSVNSPGASTLASAGSVTDAEIVPFTGIATPIVSHRIQTGVDSNGSASADGTLVVNFGKDFSFDNNFQDGVDPFDFRDIMFHELTHALGFSSGINQNGSGLDFGGSTQLGDPGAFLPFDQFISSSAGTNLLNTSTFVLDSSWTTLSVGGASPTNGLFFNGANAVAANGGSPVGLYSPTVWSVSSASHLDSDNPAFDGLVMTHQSPPGLGTRSLSPVERGILQDLGYSLVAAALNTQPTTTNIDQSKAYKEFLVVDLDGIAVADVDASEVLTATLTLADTGAGVLTASSGNGETYSSGTGVWTVSGSVVNVNAALAAVAFDPTSGTNEADTTIAVSIVDGGENFSVPVTGTISLVFDGSPPIVGVDFDDPASTSTPTNWTLVSSTFGDTVNDLVREDGVATTFDLDISIGGGANVFTTSAPAEVPIHAPSLASVDGGRIAVNSITLELSELVPNAAYNLYLFTVEEVLNTAIQQVTITGGTTVPTPFTMDTTGKDGLLLINGNTASSDRALEDDAVVATASATGVIEIVVTKTGGDFVMLSGAAIQEVSGDTTAPTAAITRAGANPTNADSVVFDVAFSEDVLNVTAADFALDLAGVTATATVSVGNAGDTDDSTYTVTVSSVAGNGTLGLDINGATDIVDGASNPLDTTPTADEVYTIDITVPTVAITRDGINPTSAGFVIFYIDFSEDVSDVDATDFVVATTNSVTANATVAVYDADDADDSTFTVWVSNIDGNGTLGLDIAGATDIADAAANALITPPTSDDIYTIDNTPPIDVFDFVVFGDQHVELGGFQTIVGDVASNADVFHTGGTVSILGSMFATGMYSSAGNGFENITGDLIFNGDIDSFGGPGQAPAVGGNIDAGGSVIVSAGNEFATPPIPAVIGSITATGDVTAGARVGGDILSNANVDIDNSHGDIGANGDVLVRGDVTGTVTHSGVLTVGAFGSVGSSAIGSVTVTPDVYTAFAVPGSSLFTSGGAHVEVPTFADVTLTPGSYGDLTIGAADLRLSAGNYFFDSISPLGAFNRIHFDLTSGDIGIFVTGDVDFDNLAVFVNGDDYDTAAANNPELASQIAIETRGNLSGNMEWFGTIYAPYGNITLETFSAVTGSVISGGNTNVVGDINFVETDFVLGPPTGALSVEITLDDANPTNASSVVFSVDFSEDVINVDASDFALDLSGLTANATVTVGDAGDADDSTYTVTVDTAAGDGTLGLDFNGATDIIDKDDGTALSTVPSRDDFYTIDQTIPTVSIAREGVNPTSAGFVIFDVDFSEDVLNVDAADFVVATTGSVTADATVAVYDADDSTFTVWVTNIAGNGMLGLDIAGATDIADAAANALITTPTTDEAYTIDNTAPIDVFDFVVFGDQHVELGGFQTIAGDVASNADVFHTGGTVSILGNMFATGMYSSAGNGFENITGDLIFNGDIDSFGGPGQAPAVGGNIDAGGSVIVSAGNEFVTPPIPAVIGSITATGDVTAAARVGGDILSNAHVDIDNSHGDIGANGDVLVRGDVTGTVTHNGTLTVGAFGSVGGSASGTVTVTPEVYTAFAVPGSSLFASGGANVEVPTFADITLNPGSYGDLTIGAADLRLSAGNYFFDSISPLGAFNRIHFDLTSGDIGIFVTGDVDFDSLAVFVNGDDYAAAVANNPELASKIALETAGSFEGNVQWFGTIYAPNGDITLETSSAVTGSVVSGGNTNVVGNINFVRTDFLLGPPIVLPTVAVTRDDANPTSADSVVFSVDFSEAVSNVDASDFALDLSGVTANGTLVVGDAGDADNSTYTVTVDTIAGDGTLGLDIEAATDIVDGASNPLDTTPTTDAVYTIDNTVPVTLLTFPTDSTTYNAAGWTDSISGTASDTGGATVQQVDVSIQRLSDNMYWSGAAFDSATEVLLTATGTTSWSLAFADTNLTDGTSYTVRAHATDTAGNVENTAVATFMFDSTAPTPTISGPASPTNSDPFDVTIDFGETVNDFLQGDITVGNGSVTALVDNGSGNFTATIDATADGEVTVDVASAVAQDNAGNSNSAATQFAVTVDTTAPTPTISGPASLTNSDPFDVAIDFGEVVSGFASGDITVGNGSVTAFVDNGAGSFTATIDAAADGQVTVDVAASVAQDTVGNSNNAATQYAVSVEPLSIVVHSSLVRISTVVDARGVPAALPTDETWIDEWTPFFIEIYATGDLAAAVVTADLSYDTNVFTVTSIQYGPLFDNADGSGTIDDAGGKVDDLGGKASEVGAGIAEQVLVARVALRPLTQDTGVAHNADGHAIEPVNAQWLSVDDARVGGVASSAVSFDPLPTTALLPVMYDVDDNGLVGFGDFSFLSASFQQSVTNPGAPSAYAVDWDLSEFVDFGDFSFLSANFGRTKLDGTPLVYPTDFPTPVLAQSVTEEFSQSALRRHAFAFATVDPVEDDGAELAAVDQLFATAGQDEPISPVDSFDSESEAATNGSDLEPDGAVDLAGGADDVEGEGFDLESALPTVNLGEDLL